MISKQRLKDISNLPSVNVAQITQLPYSFCHIRLVLGLPWLDFREKLVSFFLKKRKEETLLDTLPAENYIDFTSDS